MNASFYHEIQGFLKSMELVNDTFDKYLSYSFKFYELSIEDKKLSTISNHIIDAYRIYNKYNNKKNSKAFERKLTDSFSLVKLDDWEKDIIKNLETWFLGSSLRDYKLPRRKIDKEIFNDKIKKVSSSFIDLLINFLKGEEFEVWEFEENFKNELYYFWGGTGFYDCIFTCNEKIYLLHLECND